MMFRPVYRKPQIARAAEIAKKERLPSVCSETSVAQRSWNLL